MLFRSDRKRSCRERVAVEFSTPRSWEMVSNILNNINDDVSEVYPLITGLVGTGVAVEFRTWCNVYNQLPDMDDIFNGLRPRVPKSPDVLYALTAAMTSYARSSDFASKFIK